MPNLGEISNLLGTSLLAGAGPEGRAAATSLLNNQRELAYKKQEDEAARLQQEAQNRIAVGARNFAVIQKGLETITDPKERESLLKIADGISTQFPELGITPDTIQAMGMIQPKVSDKLPTKASLAFNAVGGDEQSMKAFKLLTEEEKQSVQDGRLVKGTDLNPDAPEGTWFIQNPSGSLTAVSMGENGPTKTKYDRITLEDGSVGVIAQTGNEPPTVVGKLTDEKGNPVETFAAQKEENIQNRANERASRQDRTQNLVQERFETNREFKERTNKVSVENAASDDLRQDLKAIKETEADLNKLDALLSGNVNALDSKAIQNTLANVLNTNVRAQAELESFKTFGNLGQRLGQAVNRFISGEYTPESLDQIRTLVSDMRNKVTNPAKEQLVSFYRGRTERQGGDPDNVIPATNSNEKPKVGSVEEAMKLPKGTHFIDPDGVERVR